ncbi:MAG: response regulator [Bdellovibrionaceae bacterium]|nr:response regulator [Pseudobdellovibrionaceae bacterium]
MSEILENKKILVVDDERDLREIICDDLSVFGAVLFEAENGRSAFDLHEKYQFDVIISDVRMPGGDGIEMLRRLKELPGPAPVILLITGFADLAPDEAAAYGVQGMLSKPFNLRDLRGLLVARLTAQLGERSSSRA